MNIYKYIYKYTFSIFILLILSANILYTDTGIQIDIVSNGMLSNAGQVLSGGSVEFYNTNTTIAKNVYRDSALNNSYGNTVTLDSSGKALVYALGTFRMVVKDSAGNLITDNSNLTFGYSTPFPEYTKDGSFDTLNVGGVNDEHGINNTLGLYPQISIVNSSNGKYGLIGVDSDGQIVVDPNGIDDGTFEVLGILSVEDFAIFKDDVLIKENLEVTGGISSETLIANSIIANSITTTSTTSVILPYISSDTIEVNYLNVDKTAEIKFLSADKISTGERWYFSTISPEPSHYTMEIQLIVKDRICHLVGFLDKSTPSTFTMNLSTIINGDVLPRADFYFMYIYSGNTIGVGSYSADTETFTFSASSARLDMDITWNIINPRPVSIDGDVTFHENEWDY